MTSAVSDKMISDFTAKPTTQAYFVSIAAYTQSLGPVRAESKSQASFAANRKFLWMWAYEKTVDGTLYLTVLLDRPMEDQRFHYVTRVGAARWNHHVVVKSAETAESEWLHDVIRAGYDAAAK